MNNKIIFISRAFIGLIFTYVILSFGQTGGENTGSDSVTFQRPLSLFSYGEITDIGVTLGYFSYNELIDLSDDIQQFTDHFGATPQIYGAPKSTETGTVFGLYADKTFYSWQNRMFLLPRVSFLFGYNTTYDGSTQQQMVQNSKGDTVGYEYDPVNYTKNNFFLDIGCDAGYAFPQEQLPFALYSGIDFKLWYRDLLANGGQLSYSTGVNNSETYYWFNVPFGIKITRPMSPTTVLGADARLDWMVYGTMKVSMSNGSGSYNYPAVTLGNRPSFRFEMFYQNKTRPDGGIKISPYIVWYGFEKSNTEEATSTDQSSSHLFLEPASRSFMVGATVSLVYLK